MGTVRRLLQNSPRDNGGVDQHGSSKGGEKWSDSEYMLDIVPTGLAKD